MNKNKMIIGIDVSKATLDLCIDENGSQTSEVIPNTIASIKGFLKSVRTPVIISMENTGHYNRNLYEALGTRKDFDVYVLNPLHLKRSMGLVRGKNDKVDAQRICSYIKKHHDSHTKWQPSSKAIEKLKILLSERKQRVKELNKLKARTHDYNLFKQLGLNSSLRKLNMDQQQLLRRQIKSIEKLIGQLIDTTEDLKNQMVLLLSIPGVGKITAWHLISITQGFTTISEARKLACFAGVAPFSNQSGVYRGKSKVSNYADKTLKTLLHLGALSAIRLDNDLSVFYHRKVAEGKNKMAVLNAIRNKIIHRVYAVIKSGKKYQNHLVVS